MQVLLSALISCLLVPSHILHAFLLPDNDEITRWTYLLEIKLSSLVASVTNIDDFKNAHRQLADVQLVKINGEEILNESLKKLDVFLENKKKSLSRLVATAEENVIQMDNTYSSIVSVDDIEFFNVKEPPSNINLTFNSHFRQHVSFNQSGVHVPLEIFDGYPEIINGLNWTASLDPVFRKNFEDDPTFRWQYFGSALGFMRIFPAFKWPEHPTLPDLFDVRRRSWFIQGSVSPKDVIILIDRSGSVHGQTLDIMKITVRALLNSLGENDYVNVAWFNNKVSWVVPCVNTLVQATAQNRRLFSDAVERLTESNLTSYTAALDFAFDAFQQFDEEKQPWSGSNCHKAIMFLSDGGTDWPVELVTRHCNQSTRDHIKIFSFACGPHPIPTVVLKEMACATGGFFSSITALGSVRVKILDYTKILRWPLILAEPEELFEWHNFYRDIGGLGMMITVTLPVFNRGENKSHENFLGVMGMDVPVDEMISMFPKYDLGSFGYSFAVNQNGYVVFHPRLRNHIIYIEDPPDVDLNDLEGVSYEMSQIRTNMINGLSGKFQKVTSIIPVGLGHAISVPMDYFYGPTKSSTFRFGIALPTNEIKLVIRMKNATTSIAYLEQSANNVMVAPWKFCQGKEIRLANQLAKSLHNLTLCDLNLVHHLLWDVKPLEQIHGIWKQSTLSSVYSKFLMTSGGLTLVHPEEVASDYLRQLDIFRNSLYKRTSKMEGCLLSVFRGRSHDITVSCRALYQNKFVTGVIGVEMERTVVQKIFETVVMDETFENNCKDANLVSCYLLNDGGVILATNQHHIKAGDFIGEDDYQIGKVLLDTNVFGKEDRLNFMSWCSKDEESAVVSAGTQYTFNMISNYLISLNWNILYKWILYFISSFFWEKVESSGPFLKNHSCVTQSSWFFYTGQKNLLTTIFTCKSENGTCERNVTVSFIPNLSLVLVVATPECKCKETPVYSVDPQTVELNHCVIKEPYRKRPAKCFHKAPKDNNTECTFNCASMTSQYAILMSILAIKFYL